MAIERTDILEKEKEAQEAEQRRQAELAEARASAHKAEMDRARLEGELEATRKAQATQQQPQGQAQWTDEQWAQAEAQTGLNKQQLIAADNLAQARASMATKAIEERLKLAEEKAEKAEAEARRAASSRAGESAMGDFYDQKPALKQYKKEVEGFLADVPESEKSDPEKMKKWLGKAEVYVRGIVGAKMNRTPGNASSASLGEDFDTGEGTDSEERIDFSGLENRGERRLVADIASEFSGRDQEDKDLLKTHSSSDGHGVRFDSEAEFKAGDAMLKKGSAFGGKR